MIEQKIFLFLANPVQLFFSNATLQIITDQLQTNYTNLHSLYCTLQSYHLDKLELYFLELWVFKPDCSYMAAFKVSRQNYNDN